MICQTDARACVAGNQLCRWDPRDGLSGHGPVLADGTADGIVVPFVCVQFGTSADGQARHPRGRLGQERGRYQVGSPDFDAFPGYRRQIVAKRSLGTLAAAVQRASAGLIADPTARESRSLSLPDLSVLEGAHSQLSPCMHVSSKCNRVCRTSRLLARPIGGPLPDAHRRCSFCLHWPRLSGLLLCASPPLLRQLSFAQSERFDFGKHNLVWRRFLRACPT